MRGGWRGHPGRPLNRFSSWAQDAARVGIAVAVGALVALFVGMQPHPSSALTVPSTVSLPTPTLSTPRVTTPTVSVPSLPTPTVPTRSVPKPTPPPVQVSAPPPVHVPTVAAP